VGVLPLMLCQRLPRTREAVSMPYATYGGPLGEDATIVRALVERAAHWPTSWRAGYAELRCLTDPGSSSSTSTLYCTFMRDLPAQPEEVLARMPKKARAEARKARDKHRLELSSGHWYSTTCSACSCSTSTRWARPDCRRAHFRALLEQFERDVLRAPRAPGRDAALGRHVLRLRRHADRLLRRHAAGRRSRVQREQLHVPRAAGVGRRARLPALRLLPQPHRLGRLRVQAPPGFEPIPLHYRYHLARNRKPPSFTPSNPYTALPRRVWSKLPLWLARPLSEWLPRYLP
jgi:hypothetical protein